MDFGEAKSINGILERARYQRDNLLEQIEYFLKKRFPTALKDSERNIEAFKKIAENMGINIELDNSVREMVLSNVDKLNILKIRLNETNLTEEEILNDFSMEETQELLDLMEPALEEENTNLVNSAQEAILETMKQKSEREKQIQDLREKRAYWQGKLDSTRRRGKKYRVIKEEIESIEKQISELEKPKVATFQERVTDITNNENYLDKQGFSEKTEEPIEEK